MKTIEVRVYIKLAVSDNFSVPLALMQIEHGTREGLGRGADIYQSIAKIEIEKVDVAPMPEKPKQKE